jgi:hypothetical protein
VSARDQLNKYFAAQIAVRAATFARHGRWQAAELEIGRWESLTPTDPEAVAMAARVLYHQGRRQEALDRIDRASALGIVSEELSVLRGALLEEDWILHDRQRYRELERATRKEWLSSAVDVVLEWIPWWYRYGWPFAAMVALAGLFMIIASATSQQ